MLKFPAMSYIVYDLEWHWFKEKYSLLHNDWLYSVTTRDLSVNMRKISAPYVMSKMIEQKI